MKNFFFQFLVISVAFCSCKSSRQQADLIVTNAKVYTVDSSFSLAQSFAVKDGKFLAVGTNEEISSSCQAVRIVDAGGMAVFPGFIDAHCHFYGYGKALHEVDLYATRSFDEVLKRVNEFAATSSESWIIGRGWDQNDWQTKSFPDCTHLDSLFPERPVLLERIDGHAALVNTAAMKAAGIHAKTSIRGGVIETKSGKLTGIFVDNAVELIKAAIPKPSREKMAGWLKDAETRCFEAGITTVDDAGVMDDVVTLIDSMQKAGTLKMRVYAMLSDSLPNYKKYLASGPFKTERLDVRSFKFYADGALGSRGACLLSPYADKNAERGFLLSDPGHFDSIAAVLINEGFQMNTHCIGDSAVRMMMNIYKKHLAGQKPGSARWRLEHLQVTTKEDIEILRSGNIIPSVQPTHATSDMYWANDRLGAERMKYAYAYRSLLDACGIIALGTDFPVERINPVYTFYAAVVRKDVKGFPAEGFQMKDALSREQALRGMTIWAAWSNFEENEKGSIQPGKFADFVILDKDIMTIAPQEIHTAKPVATYVNGECVYQPAKK